MNLLKKTNPAASTYSVLIHSVYGAVSVPAFLMIFGKPSMREEWRIIIPIFAVLGGFIGGLMEWQIDEAHEDDKD